MKEYLSEAQEVLEQQQTGAEGLSSGEASARLQKYGKNKLKEGKKESLIHKFLMELKDPMVLILIAASNYFRHYFRLFRRVLCRS